MPPKETSDRATRLGALLASRNSLIRREAADALGHFPFTNPQIPKLIRNYLQSASWETRVAASEALQAVIKTIPTSSHDIIPSSTLFSSLDLFATVRDFYPLLSCESELVTRVGSTSSFGEQRKLVDEQLDMQFAAGVSSQSFISEEDFGIVTESTSEQKLRLDTSALSIQEEQVADDNDSCIKSFCCELLGDLANAKWEVRHGASLGLAVLFKFARSSFSPALIDVISARLFQILALDTFIDFASGRSAVGPVRETVAECIAALIVAFPHAAYLDLILKQLRVLFSMDDAMWAKMGFDYRAEARKHLWLQRQAAVLVLKYHLAGPLFYLRFDEFYNIISLAFEDPHDEAGSLVSSSALSAVTALYCKKNLPEDISQRLSNIESIIYRFIDSACNPSKQQVVDVDTVIVDLLALLLIWMDGSNLRNLPYSVLISLSRLLNPLHITRSLRIVNVFSTSFSRTMFKRVEDDTGFENCAMEVIASLYRLVLFASPRGTDELIETSISCSYCIASQFLTLNRLPAALVETIGRWSACLLLDAKNAEIELVEYNVSKDGDPGKVESLCGEEIRSMNDMERIDALLTRKIQIARFLAPLISAIYDFPSVIGGQSLYEAVQLLISPILTSALLMHRLGGSLLVHSWFTYNWRVGKNMNPPVFVITLLQKMALSSEVFYDDEKFFFHYLDSAYKEFANYCRRKGVTEKEVGKIAEEGESLDLNAGKLYAICSGRIKKDEDVSCLGLRYESFKNVVATAKAVMTANITRVGALVVSALLLSYPRILLESSSLNPFIKPLLGLLRYEENVTVARHILNSLPILFRMTSEKVPCPHAKMVKQIVACLTSCESFFPQELGNESSVLLSQIPRPTPSSSSLVAESAIRALSDPFAATDLNTLLDFRKRDSAKESASFMIAYSIYSDEIRHLGLAVPSRAYDFLPFLKERLISEDPTMRYCSARCLVEIVRLDGMLPEVLKQVIVPLSDSLRSGTASVSARCGLAELTFLLSELNLEVLGGLRILAPISLRQMSDNYETVREAAAVTFRNYVPLMVLKTSTHANKPKTVNDLADKDVTDCSMDLLLGNPSRLPSLDVKHIYGLGRAVVLRHYQEEGIRWMSFIEQCGVNGILADDMGLGKTLQTLCLLAMKVHDKPSAKVLIICPPTLVNHWCTEWSKYFPSLPPFHAVDEGVRDEKWLIMKNEQFVTVASYNTVRNCGYFREIEWYYLILDEGHVIRNPTTQLFKTITSLHSQNRLILSGTPVQNTPADLWALFEFLMPGYLGSLKQFRITFLKSINACRNVNATPKEIEEGQAALERLHKSVLPFVMRRLKTEVLEDLPEKIVQDCTCEMTRVQRALYTHIVEQCNVGQPATVRGNGLSALEVLAELRKCIVHPALVGMKASSGFHGAELQKTVEESGKLMALRELFRQCGIGVFEDYEIEDCAVQDSEASHMDTHRALVFCQRLSTVQLIAELIDAGQLGSNIRYSILDGTVPVNRRHGVAENFNRDVGIDLLLLTTSVGGEGLNLIGADVVIFVEHDWNPVKDLQAMDRAHRIGQKRTVNVYRLITKSSIEEKIMRYQKFKADTANALVGADNRSLQTMATEQLVELFALDSASTSSDHSPRSTNKPKRKENKGALNIENIQSWDIEELWNQSQYDRYNVVNIAQNAEDSISRELKRQRSNDTDLPAYKQRRDV